MAAMKTMMTFVMDVGETMLQPVTTPTSPSKLSLATSLVTIQILQRMMASKTAEFSVVTFGDETTNNYLNNTQGGYDNINQVVEMSKPNPETLWTITEQIASTVSDFKGDIVGGLVVGQDILIRYNAKYKFNRILVLLTDGETEVDEEGCEDLEHSIQTAKDAGCMINVIMIGKSTVPGASIYKRENAKLLKSCAKATGGFYYEGEDMVELLRALSAGRGFGSRAMCSKTVFELSPEVRIPCVYFGLIKKTPVPSLKKFAKSGAGGGGGGGGGWGAMGGDAEDDGEDGGGGGGGEGVKRDTLYRNPNDPDEEIDFEHRVKGFRYRGQYVPLSTTEETETKLPSPPIVQLIGFLPANKISRQHFLNSPLILQAPQSVTSAQRAFRSLSTAMREKGQACLVRMVKRENSDPFLAALLPPTRDDGTLLVHELPCAEDIRDFSFPHLEEKTNLSQWNAQKHAMSEYIDSITINTVSPDRLIPANLGYYAVMSMLRNRLLIQHGGEVGATLTKFLVPINTLSSLNVASNPKALENAQKLLELFPLKKLVKEKRKKFWNEVEIVKSEPSSSSSSEGLQIAVKVQKTDPDDDESSSSSQSSSQVVAGGGGSDAPVNYISISLPTLSSGSVKPMEDFEGVLSAVQAAQSGGMGGVVDPAIISSSLDQAISTLTYIIDLLVTCGSTAAHYRKAMNCLKSLRRACILFPLRCEFFNQYLSQSIKQPYQFGKHKPFWELLVSESLSPIHSGEVSSSTVSEQQAREFFSVQAVEVVVAAPVIEEEEEDLFGAMA